MSFRLAVLYPRGYLAIVNAVSMEKQLHVDYDDETVGQNGSMLMVSATDTDTAVSVY